MPNLIPRKISAPLRVTKVPGANEFAVVRGFSRWPTPELSRERECSGGRFAADGGRMTNFLDLGAGTTRPRR